MKEWFDVDMGKVWNLDSYAGTTSTNTTMIWEILEYLIVLGTTLGYILG